MKILHITTHDSGGAGKAAYRLHKNFLVYGHHSRMLVQQKTVDDPTVIEFMPSLIDKILISLNYRIYNFIEKILFQKDEKYVYRGTPKHSGTVFSAGKILKQLSFKPDFIILHWISEFIDSNIIFELYNDTLAPIAWRFMDMGALTGGCHYSFSCKRYINQCGQCPALFSRSKNDISHKMLLRKHQYLRKIDILSVAGSTEIYQQTQSSFLFRSKKIYKILIAVDENIFKPADKIEAKKQLGIPHNKKVIFWGAKYIWEERKGFSQFIDCLQNIRDEFLVGNINPNDVFILIAGNTNKDLKEIFFQYKHIEYIENDKHLALMYQAADMFVCTSIADSGPMMINESIMCGTPVVTFDIGVAQDLVINGKTGYRIAIDEQKAQQLSFAVKNIISLDNNAYQEMSNNCRAMGLDNCSLKKEVEQFQLLFNDFQGR